MADFIKTQNSFANGEVAPEFYVRDGINGVSCLENMDVLASGALSRRSGLVSVERLRGPAKIINFSVSDTEQCIIALTDIITMYACLKRKRHGHTKIYRLSSMRNDLEQ